MSHFTLTSLILITLTSLSSTLQADTTSVQNSAYPVPMNMLKKPELMRDVSTTPAETEKLTIVDIASSNPAFSTFVKALKTADLVQKLQGDGPFTLFVPNDMAFAKLSPNTLADLLRPENKQKLANILTYHVVPTKISAADIKTMQVKTVNGKNLDIKVNNGVITVNDAKVIQTGIVGSNGVIHVIDTVLKP